MAQLIDGKLISQQIKDELKEEVAQFKAEGIDICLAVIQDFPVKFLAAVRHP